MALTTDLGPRRSSSEPLPGRWQVCTLYQESRLSVLVTTASRPRHHSRASHGSQLPREQSPVTLLSRQSSLSLNTPPLPLVTYLGSSRHPSLRAEWTPHSHIPANVPLLPSVPETLPPRTVVTIQHPMSFWRRCHVRCSEVLQGAPKCTEPEAGGVFVDRATAKAGARWAWGLIHFQNDFNKIIP